MTTHAMTAPKTADEAIAFALANLLEFEVATFLRDFQNGEPLDGWIEGLVEDRNDEEAAFAKSA